MFYFIWIIPICVLLIVHGIRRRKRILNRFAALKSLESITPDVRHKYHLIRAGCLVGMLVFAIIALAGPQYGFKWREIERKGIDIVIALDCSRSMLAEDIKPSRLERAKREVYDLLEMLDGDRIGLVAFAGSAFVQCPLTLDYESLHLFLNVLTPDFLPLGGTDLDQAIVTATAAFESNTRSEKAVILITDGENTGPGDPVKRAQSARSSGIKIFCVGVGQGQGAPIPEKTGGFKKDAAGNIVLSKLDEATLKQIAASSEAAYVHSVAGDMDLDVIYIQKIRATMENRTLVSQRKQVWEDRYQWFLAFAILLLVTELIIPLPRKISGLPILLTALMFSPTTQAETAAEAHLYYEKGNYEEALKAFTDAQLEDPDNPKIMYNIGNTYYKLGDYEAAANHFKNALTSDNADIRQKAFYNIGNAQFRSGNLEQAIDYYTQSLNIDPNDNQARQNLEFVKKIMEQQKKKAAQNPPDNTKQNDSQSDAQQNSPEQTDQPQAGNGPSEQRKGKEAGEKTGSRTASGKRTPDGSEAAAQAENAARILNRLQDQPGKALMPAYRERTIKQDW